MLTWYDNLLHRGRTPLSTVDQEDCMDPAAAHRPRRQNRSRKQVRALVDVLVYYYSRVVGTNQKSFTSKKHPAGDGLAFMCHI